MANPVVQTTMCTCSFGAAPAVLPVTSQQTVMTCNMLQATSFNVVDKLLSVLQGGSADHLTVLEPEIVKRDSTGR